MSQESQVSSITTEYTDNQDEEFISELNNVDDLYFNSSVLEFENEDETVGSGSDTQTESLNYDSDPDSIDHVYIEPSDYDLKEYTDQAKFRNDTCGCKEFYGEPCSTIVDFDKVLEFREHCKELSRNDLDLTIKTELFLHRRSGELTTSKKHKIKERERPHQEFYFNGMRVCRQTFCFAHGIEKKKLLSIAKSLDIDGLQPRTHGNSGKQQKHALTFMDSEHIKTFLCQYARDNALPLPGRLPNYKNSQVLLLPSDKSCADIHELYEKLAVELSYRSVSLRTFQRVWNELCPHITITKPCRPLWYLSNVWSQNIKQWLFARGREGNSISGIQKPCSKCQNIARLLSRSSKEQQRKFLHSFSRDKRYCYPIIYIVHLCSTVVAV